MLESGQLDAASAYYTQAIELHLHYIALPTAINLGSAADAAQYGRRRSRPRTGRSIAATPLVLDITIIGKATPAAVAFVKYTLSLRRHRPVQGGWLHVADADGDRYRGSGGDNE